MVANWRSFLVAFLTVLLHGSTLVGAKRGGGRGGGGGGGADISINLNLSGIDTATFSFYVFFAILSGLQLISAFALFKKRSPLEEFARRLPYAILIVLFTATLLTSYALGAALWTSDSGTYNRAVSTPAMYAMVDFLPRLADIFILGAVLLLLRYRRDILIADQHDSMTVQQIRANSAMKAYRYLPFVHFGIMFIASIVRLAIQVSVTGHVTLATINGFEAMDHIYTAFLIFVTFHVVVSAVVQWNQITKTPSRNHILFDQNVLSRIVKFICPALVLRILYVLASHIVIYTAGQIATFNYSVFRLVDILLLGFTYAFVIYVALGLGRLPKTDEGEKSKTSGNYGPVQT